MDTIKLTMFHWERELSCHLEQNLYIRDNVDGGTVSSRLEVSHGTHPIPWPFWSRGRHHLRLSNALDHYRQFNCRPLTYSEYIPTLDK